MEGIYNSKVNHKLIENMKSKNLIYNTIIVFLTTAVILLIIKIYFLRSEINHYSHLTKDQFLGQNYGHLFKAIVRVVPQKNIKNSGNFVIVESINGKNLDANPEFIRFDNITEEDLEIGSKYSCTAFFSGRYVGMPDSPETKGVASSLFHFENLIVIVDFLPI